MLIFYVMAFTSGGFIIYMYDYNVIKPDLICYDPQGNFQSCNSTYVCDNLDKGINYTVDWDSINTIDNWIFQLDILCKPFSG
jgi:hypothetical protein